eukprot:CAMPEP_0195571434 /NCGR_PEP_ID=MMETSP0814-20130614/4097_1 /TAXON_ID=97485 /ORGANISM="Prymnesium parvum, Strain Texoma1" /LENGTH=235 /DNA_ID=CAMNT_0040707069 /DNA_START=428 /DNA_END=1133 /DNA_ORIENTATION=+
MTLLCRHHEDGRQAMAPAWCAQLWHAAATRHHTTAAGSLRAALSPLRQLRRGVRSELADHFTRRHGWLQNSRAKNTTRAEPSTVTARKNQVVPGALCCFYWHHVVSAASFAPHKAEEASPAHHVASAPLLAPPRPSGVLLAPPPRDALPRSGVSAAAGSPRSASSSCMASSISLGDIGSPSVSPGFQCSSGSTGLATGASAECWTMRQRSTTTHRAVACARPSIPLYRTYPRARH